MKTIKNVMDSMTNTKRIMEDLREMLREIDLQYPEEEQRYQEGLIKFKAVIDEEKLALLEAEIAAEERRIASNMVYLVWRGLQQNLACHQNPVAKKFIELDYEDIHREDLMNGMPDSVAAGNAGRKLALALSDAERELNPTTWYYAYFETVAYKVAHYYGFKLGDALLPMVEPGYCSDPALTFRYGREVEDYLKVNLSKLN